MSGRPPRPERRRAIARLLALAAAMSLSVVGGPALQAGLVAALLLYGAAVRSPGLRLLSRARFWIFLAAPVIFGLFFLEGGADGGALSIAGLPPGAAAGLRMSLRALGLVLSCAVLLSPAALGGLTGLSSSPGWRGFTFALGVGQNMLATLSRSCETTWQTIRLRGGFRRKPVRMLKRFLVTVGYGTVRHGEEIVQAAAARAFDLERKGVDS